MKEDCITQLWLNQWNLVYMALNSHLCSQRGFLCKKPQNPGISLPLNHHHLHIFMIMMIVIIVITITTIIVIRCQSSKQPLLGSLCAAGHLSIHSLLHSIYNWSHPLSSPLICKKPITTISTISQPIKTSQPSSNQSEIQILIAQSYAQVN